MSCNLQFTISIDKNLIKIEIIQENLVTFYMHHPNSNDSHRIISLFLFFLFNIQNLFGSRYNCKNAKFVQKIYFSELKISHQDSIAHCRIKK